MSISIIRDKRINSTHLDRDTIKALKDDIDLRSFATQHGFNGQRHGKALQGLCPWTDNSNPSFSIFADGYKDFGNPDIKGNLFGYIINAGLARDFTGAVEYAADYLGHVPTLPAAQQQPKAQRQTLPDMPDKATQLHFRQIATHCAEYLFTGAPVANNVLQYLTSERGLTLDTIKAARLGLALNVTGVTTGITIPWTDGLNMATIRIRRPLGKLAAYFGVQDNPTDKNKYKHITGGKPSAMIYNAAAALDISVQGGAPLLQTESDFCALLAQQTLAAAVEVITLGSATATLYDGLARQFAGRAVYLAIDNDSAGQKAANIYTKIWQAAGCAVFIVTMPDGCKDVTDAIIAGHDLDAMIAAAQPVELAAKCDAEPLPELAALATIEPVAVQDAPSSDAAAQPVALGDDIDDQVERLLLALPDTWRAAMLSYMYPAIPVILDTALKLNRDGELADGLTRLFDATFTRSDLLKAGLTRGTVDRALDELIAMFTKLNRIREIHIGFSFVNIERGVYPLVGSSVLKAAIVECARYRIIEKYFPAPSGNGTGLIAYGAEDINDLVFDDMIEPIDPTVDAYAIERRYSAAIKSQPGFATARDAARAEYADLLASLDNMTCHLITDSYTNKDDYRAAIARLEIIKAEQTAGTGAQVSLDHLATMTGLKSNNGARGVRDRAGLEVKRVYADSKVSAAKLSAILDAPCSSRNDRQIGGHAEYVIFERDGEKQQRYKLPHTPQDSFADTLKHKAAYYERQGAQIIVGYRQADHMTVITQSLPQRVKRAVQGKIDQFVDAAQDAAKAARAAARAAHDKLFGETKQRPYYGLGHDPHWVALQLRALLLLVSSWTVTDGTLSKYDAATGELIATYADTPSNVLLLLSADPTESVNWPRFDAIDRDDDAVVNAYERHGSAFKDAFRAWEDEQAAANRRAALARRDAERNKQRRPGQTETSQMRLAIVTRLQYA